MSQKKKMIRSKKIKASARGEECTMEIEGVCSYNPETVVFAHCDDTRWGKGTAIKNDDWNGFYSCSQCHSVYDGHVKSEYSKEDLDWYFNKAFLQTFYLLHQKKLITFKNQALFKKTAGYDSLYDLILSYSPETTFDLMLLVKNMFNEDVLICK